MRGGKREELTKSLDWEERDGGRGKTPFPVPSQRGATWKRGCLAGKTLAGCWGGGLLGFGGGRLMRGDFDSIEKERRKISKTGRSDSRG